MVALEASIDCCRVLMRSTDDHTMKLDRTMRGSLDAGSKIRISLEGKARRDFQKFIKRQISALTLLSVACNWYVPSLINDAIKLFRV